MEKIRTIADRYLLNRIAFKVLMVIAVLITAVPYLHAVFGGYVKIVLLYGFLVIGYELLTGKLSEALRRKSNWLLIGFCVSYTMTLFINRAGALTAGVKTFAYMVVFFVLFYMTKNGQTKQTVLREIQLMSFVIVVGTFILSTVSMATFVFSISGKYLNADGVTVYYGMFENRLWGLYNPNTGSTLNCISTLLSVGGIFTVKKRLYTAFNGVNIFLQFSCLLLTGSRASYYMMLVVLVILAAFTVLKRFSRMTVRAIGAAVLAVVVTVGAYAGVGAALKAGYAYVPGVAALLLPEEEESPKETEPEQTVTTTVTPQTTAPTQTAPTQTAPTTVTLQTTVPTQTAPTTAVKEKDEIEKQDFTRLEELENREGGFFNGRAPMWVACFKTFKEAPLFGVGNENLIERTLVHFEDDTWKEHFRIGGPHNIYVTILVSCGAIGFVLIGAFAAITLIRSMAVYLKTYKKGNVWLLISICMCVMFYVTEFVESRIFFQVSTFSVFFWLFVGYMYRLAVIEKQDD